MAAVSDGNDKSLEEVDYDLQRHLKGVNTRKPDLSTLAQKGDEKVKLRSLFVLIMLNIIKTSSNQRLGECVRPKMESQVVAKEQGCWQTMPFNMPQMER